MVKSPSEQSVSQTGADLSVFAVSCMKDTITRVIHAHASGCHRTAGWRTPAGIAPLHSTAQLGTCMKCQCSELLTTTRYQVAIYGSQPRAGITVTTFNK